MSKKFTPTPHNAVFKQFLHDKATTQDFFDIWLPDDIKALCDWDTLKPEPETFIDPDMKPYQSDILYSVKAKGADGYVILCARTPIVARQADGLAIDALQHGGHAASSGNRA